MPNSRGGLIAGCQIAAIWIMACCLAIVLLGACGAAASGAALTSENAEAAGAVIAPAPAASVTTPADPAPSPSTSAGQPTVVADTISVSDTIRTVDFRNGFAYSSTMGTETPITVVDGEFKNGEFGDPEFFVFYASEPVYGDLDGDGVEEAAVITTWNGGGSGFFNSVQVFALADEPRAGHEVTHVATQSFGDRAFGGVWNIDIADQRLVVDLFADGDGSCCPHSVARVLHRLDDSGTPSVGPRLAPDTSYAPLRWIAPHRFPSDDLIEVTFLPGTSAAVIELSAPSDDASFLTDALTFDAAAGQWVTLKQLDSATPASLSLTHADSQRRLEFAIDDLGDGSSVQLPDGGLWRVDASFAQTGPSENPDTQAVAVLLLSITDAVPAEPAFGAEVRQVVVQQDPAIVATASWPDVGSADGGVLNEAVRTRVNQPLDEWVAYATESLPLPRPDEGGDYQLSHRITMVTDDLVSVHFDEYEYLCCRPYPNLRQRSLIIDVTNRRILDDADIVDVDRFGEVEAVWLAAMAASDDWEIDPTELFGRGDAPSWSSLTLANGGLNFGTDRQGALAPTETFVSFADLGDLARTVIVGQAATGSVPHGY